MFKSNKKLIILSFLFIICLVIFLYFVKSSIIDISILDENHFNLITVNSVFAGFLFSALALILGLSSNNVLIRLERADFMETIYKNIVLGIINSVISILLSIFNIFVTPSLLKEVISNSFKENLFKYYLPGLELFFLILTILTFILSVKDTVFIIKSVRNRIKSQFPDKDKIKETLDMIK